MSGDDRPTARQLILSLPHEAALGREDFVVSPVNAAAIGTIDRWPAWPERGVLLVGPPGAGKTHLTAIWAAKSGAARIEAAGVTIDLDAHRAWAGGAEITLRPKEFALLALLVANAGRAVTRDRIMAEVWDTAWLGSTKTLDTHVLSLRQKLGVEAITTLRGVGYRFEA